MCVSMYCNVCVLVCTVMYVLGIRCVCYLLWVVLVLLCVKQSYSNSLFKISLACVGKNMHALFIQSLHVWARSVRFTSAGSKLRQLHFSSDMTLAVCALLSGCAC